MGKYLLLLLVIVVLTVLLVQLPLAYVTAPVRQLIAAARDLSRGNFAVRIDERGMGEIGTLSLAYSQMVSDLRARDLSIEGLNREQREKIRLDGELKVARGIQENFLPKIKHPSESGLEIAAKYVPAAEVAGDWYHYWYNERSGESVVLVVDVSGHGAGASMFTAVIAGVFMHLVGGDEPYPVTTFISTCHRLLARFGDGHWHASMQVLRYQRGGAEAELYNAGHPPALLVHRTSSQVSATSIGAPSLVVGLGEAPDFSCQRFAFGLGDVLLLYTDALYESKNREGRPHGRRRLVNFAKASKDRAARDWTEGVHDGWVRFRGGQPAQDDFCIVSVKAI